MLQQPSDQAAIVDTTDLGITTGSANQNPTLVSN
jgi:hypothetical protein